MIVAWVWWWWWWWYYCTPLLPHRPLYDAICWSSRPRSRLGSDLPGAIYCWAGAVGRWCTVGGCLAGCVAGPCSAWSSVDLPRVVEFITGQDANISRYYWLSYRLILAPCSKIIDLFAQCISSIGQIIQSVCVSVSEWVSLSHKTSWTLYRSQSSPVSSKLATKVESQEVWLPIVFGRNPKYFYPPNRKWN